MSALFGKSSKPLANQPAAINALRIQTSAYGMPVPIVYGTARTTPNLIWYGDFLAIANTSSQSSGGKGGGGNTTSSTTYTYQTAVAQGLCEGPIVGIGTIWLSKIKETSLGDIGLSLFTGTWPVQSAWGYLTTNHPGQDLGYQGLAYVAGAGYQLGSSPNLPNHSFEIQGLFIFGGGIVDANPKDILNDFLTNPNYGALFPSARIASLTPYSNYCVASGIFLSPAIKEQKAAAEFVKGLMENTNSAVFFSEGLLKVVPYGDQVITGNGATFTPNVTPQYDLTDDDFIYEGKDPVTMMRTAPSDAYNWVKLEFLDRALEYNISIAEAFDQANTEIYARRPSVTKTLHDICDANVARIVAQLQLQRLLYIRNTYQFKLGAKFLRLEPMDVLTITDAALGLNQAQVRVTDIEQDENYISTVTVEEFPFGTATHAVYPSQGGLGYTVNYNVSAGNVNTPVIFDSPGILTVTGYEVWMAVGSTDQNYGGCEVWVSTDNASYKLSGTLYGSSRYGALTATFADHADPDTVNTCSVDLTTSHGNLLGGTAEDANLFHTLSLVGNELISFQDATLTSAYHYDLKTRLRRSVYNSPHSSHPNGENFVRLDQALFKFPYEPTVIVPGQTIYFKFLSFNRWLGGKQPLSGVSPYSHVIGNSLSFPDDVTGFAVSQNANVAVFQWNLLIDSKNAGYEIRYNPVGDSTWGNGTPLTRVTRGTQITTAKVPPGSWNFMICARDMSNNYSRTPATALMTMQNVNTILSAVAQQTDWLGTLGNFVRHCSGVLIPESTKAANLLTKAELWEQFVPYPFATCTYTTGEFDIGFDSEVRLHGDIVSLLGRGVTSGVAAPTLAMDYKLSAGSYAGFQPWTIGYVTFRYFKMMLTLDTTRGNAYIKSFTPTADSGDKTDQMLNIVIAGGGTAITFPQQYHLNPSVQATVVGSTGLLAVITPGSVTTTGCTIHIFNTSNADVGGTVNIDITGV